MLNGIFSGSFAVKLPGGITSNLLKMSDKKIKQSQPICAFQAAVFLLDDGFQGVIGLLGRSDPDGSIAGQCHKDVAQIKKIPNKKNTKTHTRRC